MTFPRPSAGVYLRTGWGYGKTSTAIGLISLDVEMPLRQPGWQGMPLLKKHKYIPSDTTLIICPSHLVDQWESEFWKFLGSTGVQLWKAQVLCSRPDTVRSAGEGEDTAGRTMRVLSFNGLRRGAVVANPMWTGQ